LMKISLIILLMNDEETSKGKHCLKKFCVKNLIF
jgi:hypothetical protein